MSQGKFSIGHVFGIGLSVVSLLVAVVQQCSPSKTLGGPSAAERLANMPSAIGPVIDPAYFLSLEEYRWQDSFPFNLEALAAAKIRYIEIEGNLLPPSDDTVRANLKLGASLGERSSIMTYFLKPEEKRLDHVYSKKLGTSGGQVFSADNVYYKPSRYSGYPEIRRTYSMQGADFEDNGVWILQNDGKPLSLTFEKGCSLKFLYEPKAEICLNTCLGNPTMEIRFADSTLRRSALISKSLAMKTKVLSTQGEGTEPYRIIGISGSMTQPRLVIEWDSQNRIQSIWENKYDSLGRPLSRRKFAGESETETESIQFQYDTENGNLLGWTNDLGHDILRVEITYTAKGWPERMVKWIENQNGTIRILSRTFFSFKQS